MSVDQQREGWYDYDSMSIGHECTTGGSQQRQLVKN